MLLVARNCLDIHSYSFVWANSEAYTIISLHFEGMHLSREIKAEPSLLNIHPFSVETGVTSPGTLPRILMAPLLAVRTRPKGIHDCGIRCQIRCKSSQKVVITKYSSTNLTICATTFNIFLSHTFKIYFHIKKN